jgi:pSer/pThr/pTyr-binding forkhead associated (FHA) protein
MPRFTVFHRSQAERSFAVEKDVIVIGRVPGLDVELPSSTVSRQHARIRAVAGEWVLEDAGSVNGVFVRGQRVTRHVLAPGDQVRIEDYTIVFEPPDDLYQETQESAAGAEPKAAPKLGMTFLSARQFVTEEHDTTGGKPKK